MNRVRVFIATTEGPVAVQKITAEDPDVPSVACRDGTTEVLAISRDYTRFVDRGTGLVAALTGHGAYRLDLDRAVDGGRSWQLPVLLAHLLEEEGRLAGPDEPADLALLATGEVDRDQRVRRVGRIPEKLAAAGDLIARHGGEHGPPLVLVLPAADRTPAVEAELPAADGTPGGMVRVLAWERVLGLAALGAPLADQTEPGQGTRGDAADTGEGGGVEGRSKGGAAPTAPSQGRAAADGLSGDPATVSPPPGAAAVRPRRRVVRTAIAMLLVAAAAGVAAGAAWWNGPRQWETLRRAGDYQGLENALRQAVVPFLAERFQSGLVAAAPSPESLVFSVVEQRTADGRPCAHRDFRSGDRTERANLTGTPIPPLKPDYFRSERAASLCQAIYRVTNEDERLSYLYFAVRPTLSFAAGEAEVPAVRRAAAVPPGASLALDLDLHPHRLLGADLMILAARSPSPQIRHAFELATDAARAEPAESGEAETGPLDLTALPALGLTVKGASHAILR